MLVTGMQNLKLAHLVAQYHLLCSSHLETLPAHGSMHTAVSHGVHLPYTVESDGRIICGFCCMIPSWDAEQIN